MKGSRNEKLSGIIICYTWPEIFIFILFLCLIISTTALYEMYIKQIKKVASRPGGTGGLSVLDGEQ